MDNDKLYLIQDDSDGTCDENITLTDKELEHVEELKKKYQIKQ